MAIPERIEAPTPADHLAVLSRAVFQAGLSWKIIESKWDAYLRLFNGFDPRLVAAYDDADVERILADGGIVRTRKKIVATVANAKKLLSLATEFGSIDAYLRSFASYDELARDLQSRYAYLGPLSAYYYVFRVGGTVPRFESWETTIAGDHPRMREMIAHARDGGWSG